MSYDTTPVAEMDAYQLVTLLKQQHEVGVDAETLLAVMKKLEELAPYEYPDLQDEL